jgi:hypothetical protein
VVFKFVFSPVFQVGVTRKNNSVSPLSLGERARVRGFSILTLSLSAQWHGEDFVSAFFRVQ